MRSLSGPRNRVALTVAALLILAAAFLLPQGKALSASERNIADF